MLTDDDFRSLRLATRIGQRVRLRLPADEKKRSVVGVVIDEVALIRDRHKLVIQQIRFAQCHIWDDDEVAYRIAYCRLHKGRLDDHATLTWHYRSVPIAASELAFLLQQAAHKKWTLTTTFV